MNSNVNTNTVTSRSDACDARATVLNYSLSSQAPSPRSPVRRARWLQSPPKASKGDPWYAFRSVSHRWVDENPQSRQNAMKNILERLFGVPFPKARPPFLRNPASGRCLEIDAYSSEVKVGGEFMGIQHYEFPNPFHSTRARFLAQCQRDALKVALCKEHGVRLIVVPHTIDKAGMEKFIREQVQDLLDRTITSSAQASAQPQSGSVLVDMMLSASDVASSGSSCGTVPAGAGAAAAAAATALSIPASESESNTADLEEDSVIRGIDVLTMGDSEA